MISQSFKNFFKKVSPFKVVRKSMRKRKEIRHWHKNGKQSPPPHLIKQHIINNYRRNFSLSVLIETGTYMGDMVDAMRKCFKKIYSIELDETLYRNAKEKFSELNHVSIIHGNSAAALPLLLSGITEPVLFWLDGHFSGGITAKGDVETPIFQELRAIFNHTVKKHVILIDDAHCFIGQNDYPTISKLQKFVDNNRPGAAFEVSDNIIRIY